jgi:hypothetical protein
MSSGSQFEMRSRINKGIDETKFIFECARKQQGDGIETINRTTSGDSREEIIDQ